MKRLIVFFFLGLMMTLALPGIAQVPYVVNMGFNISFSALSNSPALSDDWIFGIAGYSLTKPWPPYSPPNIRVTTNNLDIEVQWASPDALAVDVRILELETNGSFTPVVEATNLSPVNAFGINLTLTTNQVRSLIAGNWYLEVDFNGSNYIGNLSPNYKYAYGPEPAVTIPPDTENVLWNNTVISPNNHTAKVIFDASNTIDPFYLPIQYYWTVGTNLLSNPSAILFTDTGVIVTNVFDVGAYSVEFQANDSIANGFQLYFNVNVITASQAVDSFISDLQTALIPSNKKRILVNVLSAASIYFNHGHMARGCAKLEEYEKLVKAFHFDSTKRSALLQPVQDILDAFKVPERFKSFR